MLVQTIFAMGLLVGVALSVWRGCPLLTRSALVLGGNWVACEVAVIATGAFDPVVWFIFIDTVAAIVLLWRPAGKTQAAIGAVYVMQIGLHIAQWPGGVAVGQYLSVLTVGGSLQIAFLILGAVDGDGRKVRSDGLGRGPDGRFVAHGATGVARGNGQ